MEGEGMMEAGEEEKEEKKMPKTAEIVMKHKPKR